jgi:putative transposase
MRTIRRVSLQINRTKWDLLCNMARCYRAEKNTHLPHYHVDAQFAAESSERGRRDELLAAGYTSANGMQGRMWKMAQKDAYETIEKQWAALRAELTPLIQRHEDWSDTARHYANWLIYTPQRMAQLISGKAPAPTAFSVPQAEQRMVRNYLRRVIRRKRGQRPVAKTARSIAFDPNMYSVFEKDGRQYVSLMGLKPRKRVVVPLTGNTPIRGNLRVVLDFERQRVAVHYTAEVKRHAPLMGEACGLDAGVSEVFTDEKENRYSPQFGQVIAKASDLLCDKGRKRNKLHQIAKQAEAQGDHAKAGRMRKFNLGCGKQHRRTHRVRVEMERQINTALNQVLAERQPSVMVTEKLDIRSKAKSKKIARRVSLWTRRILKERVEFKASAEGFRREQVNPAYSSQTCPKPECGFVHAHNRCGDRFQCLHCGHMDDADRVAAANLKARLFDPEIHLDTPKVRVKEILLMRLNARLERGDNTIIAPTVSGRTPGARGALVHRQLESETPVTTG